MPPCRERGLECFDALQELAGRVEVLAVLAAGREIQDHALLRARPGAQGVGGHLGDMPDAPRTGLDVDKGYFSAEVDEEVVPPGVAPAVELTLDDLLDFEDAGAGVENPLLEGVDVAPELGRRPGRLGLWLWLRARGCRSWYDLLEVDGLGIAAIRFAVPSEINPALNRGELVKGPGK